MTAFLAACPLCVASATALASPVPADELSLLNGADLFQKHCTQCHGWDPSEQYSELYGEDPVEVEDALAELTRPAPEPAEPDFVEVVNEYWPEYAERPPEPEVDEDEALRSDILSDVTAAIDDIYGDDVDPWGWEVSDYDEYETYGEESDGYDESIEVSFGEDELGNNRPMPGTTDLTDPRSLNYGTRETDLFNNIAEGTGPMMPGFRDTLASEEDIWNLVNYIRSLWGEDFVD